MVEPVRRHFQHKCLRKRGYIFAKSFCRSSNNWVAPGQIRPWCFTGVDGGLSPDSFHDGPPGSKAGLGKFRRSRPTSGALEIDETGPPLMPVRPGAGAAGPAIKGRRWCRMHRGKNRGPSPGNSHAITRGRYSAAAVDRLAPPRHRPVPPRLPLLPLSPPLIVRLPPPSGAARPERSRKTPSRPVSSPDRAHAPADTVSGAEGTQTARPKRTCK
jgi:hypothetical protein